MIPLTIGVDARELLGDATGVGRYLGELLRRWTIRPDAGIRRFVLYAPEAVPLALPSGTSETRVVAGGRGTWWEQTALRRTVRRESPDVFFAPAYTAPLGLRSPLAVTIHDVSFFAHPEWFRRREGLRRRLLTARAARRASAIFTDSEFSRAEIQTHIGVESERIHVIPPGVTPRHGTRAAERTRERLVLYVGSLFNRRRLPQLIEAFGLATTGMPDARLVLVGGDRTWPPQDLSAVAAAHGVSDRVERRDYVDDAELSSLYGRASVFVFLSEYEGFGLTPLEALAARVPIVVLDTAVAREVYGPAAVYVRDVSETAAAIGRLLGDRAAGRQAVAEAEGVLARYSWQRAAEATLRLIERVGGRS